MRFEERCKDRPVPMAVADFAHRERSAQTRLRAGPALVEKFDTELLSKFSAKSSNFRRLVLSCINADFCVQILILQRFSRSTSFAILCTAQISKLQQKFVKLFSNVCLNFCKIVNFQHFFNEFCTDSDENFSEFR